MRALTVSDAHLLHPDDDVFGDFLAFLDTTAAAADVLVLNGDIFEFLVGRQRRALAQYRPVLERIERLAAGRQLVYLEGNHDFHLERVLPGTVELCERWEATIGGVRTLWLHGDTILSDRGYGLLRWLLRRPAVRLGTEVLPPELVWRLATLWADSSRSMQGPTERDRVERFKPRVEAVLDEGYGRLITGHLHFALKHRTAAGHEWVSLGDWLRDRWYHELDETGSHLRQFSQPGAATDGRPARSS